MFLLFIIKDPDVNIDPDKLTKTFPADENIWKD